MKVARFVGTIGYPGGVMAVPEPFAWAFARMVLFTAETFAAEGSLVHLERSKVSLHDFARNDLVKNMRGDWLFMVDTDSQFQPDLLCRMVSVSSRYGLDLVTGLYVSRQPPFFPVIYANNAEGKREHIVQWDESAEVFEVDSAGAGALLVRRSVFERIAAELGENPFDRVGRIGEDHSFFDRCRRLGIKAWCAPRIEVEHLEYYAASRRDMQLEREPDNFYQRAGLGGPPLV